ncbi:MAG: family 43 glycosylhydrolase [Clostridiaceae bacterium]|nr:family 43 glycosylhydrolase [Clostridiaceae bacterium]
MSKKPASLKSSKIIAMALTILMVFGTFGTFQPVFADTPVGSSDKGDGTYTNPVIWADVPDQDIIRVGDAYYMSSTTMHMCPGVPIMKSYDLVNWETISYCYLVLDDRDATTLRNNRNMYANGTWASTLRYKDGTFYLVVPSPTTNKTYFFQTEDPENQPWRRYEVNARYHDCSLLLDDDGRNWLVYGNNPLYIIEVNEDVTGIKEGATPQVLIQNIHAPDPVTGVTPTSGLAEGAHIQKINGKYYIFCITWPPGKPRTQVCHRSDNLFGPYEAKTVAQENVNGAGVAQGGIVDDGKGNWFGHIFRDSGSVGRAPWIMPIHWVDGWPMFGDDATGMKMTRGGPKPISGDFEIKSIVSSDEFYNNAKKPTYYDAELPQDLPEYRYYGSNLNLAWQWNHNPDNRYWSLTERPGWLRLRTGHLATNLLNARNTLTQRTFGPVSSAEIAMDVSNMKNGDRAGLALFTARYGAIEVRMDNDQKTLVMINSSSTTSHNDVASVPLTSDKIYLKADADFRNQTDKGTFYYSYDGLNWTQLGNTQQMVYGTDNHFMGYRFALYNFATQTLGGYVDFDYYRISDELKGATPQTVLGAEMSGAIDILGTTGTEADMPINLDPLPAGNYSEIAVSIDIPSEFKVKDVVFSQNVTGKKSWNQIGNQLIIDVTGSGVNFTGSGRSLFATVKLEVAEDLEVIKTVTAAMDYVKVKGGNIVYDVSNAKANFKVLSKYGKAPVEGIDLPDTLTVKEGFSKQIIPTFIPVYAYDQRIEWESSNTNVATVDENGVVTGVSEGEATITATTVDGGFKDTCLVSVVPRIRVTEINLDKTQVTLEGKVTEVITASVLPSDADIKNVKFVSSNEEVVKVIEEKYNPETGTTTATIESVMPGEAVITAYSVSDEEVTATCNVLVKNTAPVVNITSSSYARLPEINLTSTVTDDGMPSNTLDITWSLVSGPGDVEFENPKAANTKVTVSALGEYEFKLTVTDGELTTTANIKVTVLEVPNGGGNIAWYRFDEESGAIALDSSGLGNDATIYKATGNRAPGLFGNALQLQGSNEQYAELPDGIMSDIGDFTISTWINASSISTWARVFDFGNDTDTNMFFTVRSNNNTPRFAIKVNGSSEQIVNSSKALSANTWYHIAVTRSGNTVIMYINGEEVGRNNNVTFRPSNMGVTVNNYIGRSQWPDPYFDGRIDEFSIFDYALSPAEIKTLTITSIPSVEVSTEAGVAPVLPETVTVNYIDGTTGTVAVTWDAIDPSSYASEGTFTVKGTVKGTAVTATCNVTVEEPPKVGYIVDTTFSLDKLVGKKLLTAYANVENVDAKEVPVLAIVALFDGEGRMVNVAFISKVIPQGESETLIAGFKLPDDVTGHCAKVFVWEGEDIKTSPMNPLSNVVSLYAEE